MYSYGKPLSAFPLCRFNKGYTVDEKAYRLKKREAFVGRKKEEEKGGTKKWKTQRDALIAELFTKYHLKRQEIVDIFLKWGSAKVGVSEISRIVSASDQKLSKPLGNGGLSE